MAPATLRAGAFEKLRARPIVRTGQVRPRRWCPCTKVTAGKAARRLSVGKDKTAVRQTTDADISRTFSRHHEKTCEQPFISASSERAARPLRPE